MAVAIQRPRPGQRKHPGRSQRHLRFPGHHRAARVPHRQRDREQPGRRIRMLRGRAAGRAAIAKIPPKRQRVAIRIRRTAGIKPHCHTLLTGIRPANNGDRIAVAVAVNGDCVANGSGLGPLKGEIESRLRAGGQPVANGRGQVLEERLIGILPEASQRAGHRQPREIAALEGRERNHRVQRRQQRPVAGVLDFHVHARGQSARRADQRRAFIAGTDLDSADQQRRCLRQREAGGGRKERENPTGTLRMELHGESGAMEWQPAAAQEDGRAQQQQRGLAGFRDHRNQRHIVNHRRTVRGDAVEVVKFECDRGKTRPHERRLGRLRQRVARPPRALGTGLETAPRNHVEGPIGVQIEQPQRLIVNASRQRGTEWLPTAIKRRKKRVPQKAARHRRRQPVEVVKRQRQRDHSRWQGCGLEDRNRRGRPIGKHRRITRVEHRARGRPSGQGTRELAIAEYRRGLRARQW